MQKRNNFRIGTAIDLLYGFKLITSGMANQKSAAIQQMALVSLVLTAVFNFMAP